MQQFVENSSRFEGTCNLQVFKFQEQRASAKSSQKLRLHKRSTFDEGFYGFSGVLYVFKGNHGITIKVQMCIERKRRKLKMWQLSAQFWLFRSAIALFATQMFYHKLFSLP
jgi:hypothetical protein